MKWTQESARIALRMEAVRIGRTPRDCDLRSPDRVCASLKTYHRLFGSLGAAQSAAGLPLNYVGGNTGWRKPTCKRGHPRTPDNLDTQGHCIACSAFWRSRTGRGPIRPRRVSGRVPAPRAIDIKTFWLSTDKSLRSA